MAVLIDSNTKAITHGFTGKNGAFHFEPVITYGAKAVCSASPDAADAICWPIAGRQTLPERRAPVAETVIASYTDPV